MYHPKGLFWHSSVEKELLEKVNNILKNSDINNLKNIELDEKKRRDCKISWITPEENKQTIEIFQLFWNIFTNTNMICNWNFDIKFLENIQYTKYDSENFYDWHIDTIKEDESTTRKLSMTFLLNDDFEGGEFQLETKLPFPDDVTKKRYETIPLKKGDFLIFHSDIPHRVTPITSGTRETLVAWANGPLFK
jgi:PKHD-type hydroxylase